MLLLRTRSSPTLVCCGRTQEHLSEISNVILSFQTMRFIRFKSIRSKCLLARQFASAVSSKLQFGPLFREKAPDIRRKVHHLGASEAKVWTALHQGGRACEWHLSSRTTHRERPVCDGLSVYHRMHSRWDSIRGHPYNGKLWRLPESQPTEAPRRPSESKTEERPKNDLRRHAGKRPERTLKASARRTPRSKRDDSRRRLDAVDATAGPEGT